ncbi:glycosyltransferase [Methanoregula sp.]|uniref:glycosyltransferase n=1 Tax=Methanoregula sp. TaxID=2052170 RepID=UPI003568464E
MAHVLVSPLNWGLGHATRDIPVIRTLLAHGHEVTIAACGNALSVLRKEFPDCHWIEYPDYPIPFGSGHLFIPKFCATLPFLFRATVREHATLEAILAKDRYDLVISDNRLGVYSSRVPSIFISHQLHYHLPLLYWPVECLGILVNQNLHERYDRIIVPDNPPGPLSLAGKLSRPQTDVARERVFFSGILSGTRQIACTQDLDYLVVISGPEPQRTFLEKTILANLKNLDGSGVVLLGSPQKPRAATRIGDWTCVSYVSTEEKVELMNRAQCVICRSGYTTMMELAELGKDRALLIPTPGQTEQEYLSWYYEQNGWYHSQDQNHLDLKDDLELARRYRGFPAMPKTSANTRRLYDEILAEYLE